MVATWQSDGLDSLPRLPQASSEICTFPVSARDYYHGHGLVRHHHQSGNEHTAPRAGTCIHDQFVPDQDLGAAWACDLGGDYALEYASYSNSA